MEDSEYRNLMIMALEMRTEIDQLKVLIEVLKHKIENNNTIIEDAEISEVNPDTNLTPK